MWTGYGTGVATRKGHLRGGLRRGVHAGACAARDRPALREIAQARGSPGQTLGLPLSVAWASPSLRQASGHAPALLGTWPVSDLLLSGACPNCPGPVRFLGWSGRLRVSVRPMHSTSSTPSSGVERFTLSAALAVIVRMAERCPKGSPSHRALALAVRPLSVALDRPSLFET